MGNMLPVCNYFQSVLCYIWFDIKLLEIWEWVTYESKFKIKYTL